MANVDFAPSNLRKTQEMAHFVYTAADCLEIAECRSQVDDSYPSPQKSGFTGATTEVSQRGPLDPTNPHWLDYDLAIIHMEAELALLARKSRNNRQYRRMQTRYREAVECEMENVRQKMLYNKATTTDLGGKDAISARRQLHWERAIRVTKVSSSLLGPALIAAMMGPSQA